METNGKLAAEQTEWLATDMATLPDTLPMAGDHSTEYFTANDMTTEED